MWHANRANFPSATILRITRIGKNSTRPSHVPFIRAFNRQPWNPRLFSFFISPFSFFLETQIRVANFPPLCSVTAIKFGIQKCTIIFLTCEITYRRMDLTIVRRTMRSESKTALSFLIAQFHRMSRSDPNYEFTSSHRPNSRGILRQSPFPLTPTSAFCIPKHSRILTRHFNAFLSNDNIFLLLFFSSSQRK